MLSREQAIELGKVLLQQHLDELVQAALAESTAPADTPTPPPEEAREP
jgi:hypothetical protein